MSQKSLDLLTKISREGSDIVPARLGWKQVFLLNHPDYITQLLSDRDLFPKFLKGYSEELYDFIGEGLLSIEGNQWLHQRRLIQPIFYQQRIAAYAKVMVACTENLLKTWLDGETRDIHTDMIFLTLKIVMKTMFNIKVSEKEAKNLTHAVNQAMHWHQSQRQLFYLKRNIRELFLIPSKIRYKRALQVMDETIYNFINQQRKSALDTNDLLSMLIEIRDEADGACMSDKQIRDEMVTLMLAGHETAANALILDMDAVISIF